MGAPVVVPVGRTSVAWAIFGRTVVVIVVVGCVNVVVAAHLTFSCRATSLAHRSDWLVRLLLHDPVGLIASDIAGLFAPVLLRYSSVSSAKLMTLTTILAGMWSTESTQLSADQDWVIET